MNKIFYSSLLVLAVIGCTVGQDMCIICDSGDEPACIDPTHHRPALLKECETQNNNSCYSRVVDRRVVRGCLGELTLENRNTCNSSDICQICSTVANGCNSGLFPVVRLSCHECTGNENSTCAAEISTPPTVCRLYEQTDRCYTRRGANNVTERGCISANVCREDGEECNVCDGHGCNSRTFNASNAIVASTALIVLSVFFGMKSSIGRF